MATKLKSSTKSTVNTAEAKVFAPLNINQLKVLEQLPLGLIYDRAQIGLTSSRDVLVRTPTNLYTVGYLRTLAGFDSNESISMIARLSGLLVKDVRALQRKLQEEVRAKDEAEDIKAWSSALRRKGYKVLQPAKFPKRTPSNQKSCG